MVSKGEGGSSSGSGSDIFSDSELSDSHLDSLVDDIIGKLHIYPAYNKANMTIKNRKDRIKADRQNERDGAGPSSGSSRHAHAYKPYAFPDDRKDGQHRSRGRTNHSHEAFPKINENTVYQGASRLADPLADVRTFSRVQPRLPTTVTTEPILPGFECRNSSREVVSPHQPILSPSVDKENGNNSEDEYHPGSHPFEEYTPQLKNREHFSQYITEEFDQYVDRKRDDACFGNHIEIQAIAELYNRPVEIYRDSVEPINVFHADYSKDFPIRLSYHGRVHYNSIVDPFNPSFGHGLGMPNYQPNLTEPDLIAQAIGESEATQLEDTMLRDKMAETDQSEIDRCIEAQAVRESYYDYLKQIRMPHAESSSSGKSVKSPDNLSRSASHVASSSNTESPSHLRPNPGSSILATPLPSSSRQHQIPTELRGLDEDSIIAMVIEKSRHEYLESLRIRRSSPSVDHHGATSTPPHEPSNSPRSSD